MSVNESVPSGFGNPFQGLGKSSTHCGNLETPIEADPLKEDLSKFVDMVNSSDKTIQLQGLVSIRKLLSLKENPPIQDIIDSGVVPKLLEFMKWDDEVKFQYESAWAVTNICSGSSQDVEYVVNLGGLDIIINLLDSSSAEVLDQAVWALGNVAGDNTTYRNMCLDRESMDKLVNVLLKFPTNASIKRNAVWAMSNLLRGKPVPQWNKIAKGIPVLRQIIAELNHGEALIDALWGISWASELYIQEVIDLGCVPYLVNHLQNNQLSVLIPALRALGNIVTGNDSQTNAVLSCPEFLSRVFDLVSNPKKTVRKEACWLISNIAAGNHYQISQILDHPQFIAALTKSLTQDVQEVITEASWALGNLASGASNIQISKMVKEYGYVNSLGVMLDNTSPKVKQIGLEAILNVLNSGEGAGVNPYKSICKGEGIISKVEEIMESGNHSLVNIATDILTFFEGSEAAESENEIQEKEQKPVNKAEEEDSESEDEEDEEEEEEEEDDDESSKGGNNEDEEYNGMYHNLERED